MQCDLYKRYKCHRNIIQNIPSFTASHTLLDGCENTYKNIQHKIYGTCARDNVKKLDCAVWGHSWLCATMKWPWCHKLSSKTLSEVVSNGSEMPAHRLKKVLGTL